MVSQARGPRGYEIRICDVLMDGRTGCKEAMREPYEYPCKGVVK